MAQNQARTPKHKQKTTITAKQLLELAQTLTSKQLKRLNLNTRADGTISAHGR